MATELRRPHCKFTRNPCGTDTIQVGHVCQCDACQAHEWGRREGIAAQAATIEALCREIELTLPTIHEVRLNNANDLTMGVRRTLDYQAHRLTAAIAAAKGGRA